MNDTAYEEAAEGSWDENAPATDEGQKSFKCEQCGAKMTYVPGSATQNCPYCDHVNAIPQSEEDIVELDRAFLSKAENSEDSMEVLTIKCQGCGAESSFDENITSKQCPFCGMDIVATAKSRKLIKPKSLLPFNFDGKEAHRRFKEWIGNLWFAPKALKRMTHSDAGLTGMYVPYWTYDSDTTTFYRGQRGDHYWEEEEHRVHRDGKWVTETRRVQKTEWTRVSGTVWRNFNDVLIIADDSLPRKYANKLEPWDLKNLVPYQDEYLSGFRAESYHVDLKDGFGQAKKKMGVIIDRDIRRDIGGDEQRIDSKKTKHANISFKHILLPIWLNAYRFKDRSYRFLVNGRTGEVQGERPWDWFKIGLTVGGAAAAIGLLYWFFAMG